jgi:peptidylprolyl isomerase
LRGLEEAVMSMKKGEKANVTVKSKYGYGESGSDKVPANEDLKYEIELIEFERVRTMSYF